MPSISRFSSAAVSLIVAVASSGSAAAQATSPGWMYTANTTVDSGGAGRGYSLAMKTQVTARNLRLEFVQVSGMPSGAAAEGMSYVLDDRDSTMTMLMPTEHSAMVMSLNGMFGAASAMRGSMMPKIELHTTNRVDNLGPGERILGHATHHYRVTTTGAMDITIRGETCTQPMDAVADMWIAPDVDLMPAMQTMLKHYGSAFGVGDFDEIKSVSQSTLPKGTAMRQISKSTRRGANGNPVTVTSTTEYVEMSQAPIADAVFAVPSDYKIMDSRKMMADVPAGVMDSIMTQNAANGQDPMKKALCPSTGKH